MSPVASDRSSPTLPHPSIEGEDGNEQQLENRPPNIVTPVLLQAESTSIDGDAQQPNANESRRLPDTAASHNKDMRPTPDEEALFLPTMPRNSAMPAQSNQHNQPLPGSTQMGRTSYTQPLLQDTVVPTRLPQNNEHLCQPRGQSQLVSLKAQIAVIRSYINSAGGRNALDSVYGRPRFDLLLDACEKEDWFYVALHQFFCVWDTRRTDIKNIPGIPSLPTQELLARAFGTLGQLIRQHTKSTNQAYLHWFAAFPAPIVDLAESSPTYRQLLSDVGKFLSKLVSEWKSLGTTCTGRGYPPLVTELLVIMKLPSPVLQRVAFVATRRNMGIQDKYLGAAMDDIFSEDVERHQRFGEEPSIQQGGESQWDLALRQRYIQLLRTPRQHRRTSTSTNTNPYGPAPLVQSRSATFSNVIPTSNESTMPGVQRPMGNNQNAGFTGQTAGHHLPNQLMQPHRKVNSSGPPNAGMVSTSTYPPNVNGLRVYSQSPMQLQNSPLQSPIQQGGPWSSPMLANGTTQAPVTMAGYVPIASNSMYHPLQASTYPGLVSPHQFSNYRQQATAQSEVVRQQQQFLQQQFAQQHFMQAQQVQQAQQAQSMQNQQYMAFQQSQQHAQIYPQPMVPSNRPSSSIRNGNTVNVSTNHTPSNPLRSARPNGMQPPQTHSVAPLTAAPNTIVHKQGQEYGQKHPLLRPVIPPLGFVYPDQQNVPQELKTLHQAHLRSPRLVAEIATHEAVNPVTKKYYQYVKELVTNPILIPTASPMLEFAFDVPSATYQNMIKGDGMDLDRLTIRKFKAESLSYRLRCIYTKPGTSKCLESEWVISDTAWPEVIFLEINGEMLEIRRKLHHGKDQPIDITKFIKPPTDALESSNQITVAMPKSSQGPITKTYFIAVEVIEIAAHDDIMESITTHQRIPASETLENIKNSLTGASLADEDDIAMTISDLSVSLTDPFTAQSFEIPLRGNKCKHRECFDLDTFLQTRLQQRKKPDQPCMVDVWRCPLCGCDARPSSLIVDEFFVQIRESLLERGILEDTKAIIVKDDGSWNPKVEKGIEKKRKAGEYQGEDESDGEGRARKSRSIGSRHASRPATAVARPEPDVVELD